MKPKKGGVSLAVGASAACGDRTRAWRGVAALRQRRTWYTAGTGESRTVARNNGANAMHLFGGCVEG